MIRKGKQYLTLAAMICLPVVLYAKEFPIGLVSEIGGGFSRPSKDYSAYQTPFMGLANNGLYTSSYSGYQMSSGWGIGLRANILSHNVRSASMAEHIWEENKTAASVQVESSAYSMLGFSACASKRVAITDKLYVKLEMGLGLLWTTTPGMTIEIENSPPVHQEIKAATSNSFMYQPELAIGYSLGKGNQIQLFASSLNSNPTFRFLRNDAVLEVNHSVSSTNIGIKYVSFIARSKA